MMCYIFYSRKVVYYGQGYTYDVVLGIFFAQFRFYDPNLRRFLSQDPIKDGHNWYAAMNNNPITFIDPWGLEPADRSVAFQQAYGAFIRRFPTPDTFSTEDYIRAHAWLAEIMRLTRDNEGNHVFSQTLLNPRTRANHRPTISPPITPETGWYGFNRGFRTAFVNALTAFREHYGLEQASPNGSVLNQQIWNWLRSKFFELLYCQNLHHINLRWPFQGDWEYASSFGWRDTTGRFHHGADFALDHGTEVRAAHRGTVFLTYDQGCGRGHFIRIKCDRGGNFMTVYSHLQEFKVGCGDVVPAGRLIALSGESGTGCHHLHFEVRTNVGSNWQEDAWSGFQQNPWMFLPRR